jgi:hypothetical protein
MYEINHLEFLRREKIFKASTGNGCAPQAQGLLLISNNNMDEWGDEKNFYPQGGNGGNEEKTTWTLQDYRQRARASSNFGFLRSKTDLYGVRGRKLGERHWIASLDEALA